MSDEQIKSAIRDIPDFPKPGIVFKDITPVLQNPALFQRVIAEMSRSWVQERIEAVVCVEARGFIFGSALALALQAGLVPVRKKGKLPFKTVAVEYALEYGTDVLEIHVDAVVPGARVLIVDDVLATGGTVSAVASLLSQCGAQIVGCAFFIELGFLHGRERLAKKNVTSLICYP